MKSRFAPLNAESYKILQGWLVVSLAGEETFIEAGLENGSAKAFTGRSVQRFLMYIGRAADLECPTTHVLCHNFSKNLIDADIGLEIVAVLPG